MSAGYSILPLIYDRWQLSYGKDYSSMIFPRLLESIKEHNVSVSSMLDLACGTGTLCLLMARKGWKVWGVDGSEGMIDAARKKLNGKKKDIEFLRQDMRELSLPEKVGLVTCMFDSLNHLISPAELLTVFLGVYATLEDGGIFIFDVNNQLCFKTLWKQTETIHHEDFTMILQNTYQPATRMADSQVTVFLKNGDRYERLAEVVRERYYPKEEVASLLQRAGFSVLQSEDFNFTGNPQVGKIKTWWVARKN